MRFLHGVVTLGCFEWKVGMLNARCKYTYLQMCSGINILVCLTLMLAMLFQLYRLHYHQMVGQL
jgi:hypothetical protein